MARYGAKRSVADVLGQLDVEDWKLHYASWEDNFVSRRVIISVHGWDSHAPAVAINWLAES